ncbi:hypothetical protein NL676_037914 [Syzygium grande]|nr:hypothetical protein NL676_037914 [Syzygium grande]
MGGHHSKPESRAKAPMAWPPQPPPPPLPFPCPYVLPFTFLPQHPPPKSHWGPKPVSHPVSIPASMPSFETASVPSSKGVSAPALAKIGISKSSETIQLEDMKIKVRRTRIKTLSRRICRTSYEIKMLGRNSG